MAWHLPNQSTITFFQVRSRPTSVSLQMSLKDLWKFVLEDQALYEITAVITSLSALLFGLSLFLSRTSSGRWLPCEETAKAKRRTELWFLVYGAFWISVMLTIIAFELYTLFDRIHYAVVLGALAAPLYLQPILFPSWTGDENVGLLDRYSFKANVWIGIFGFIGNYW